MHRAAREPAATSPERRRDAAPERAAADARCADGDLRCGCGSLLARIVARAVELKCRRCKRTWSIPLA